MRNGSLWSNVSFRESGYFSLKHYTRQARILFIRHLKPDKRVQQGCFFFHYFLATVMTNYFESKFSQICYFMHYVETHQVGMQVFDNYQTCPGSISKSELRTNFVYPNDISIFFPPAAVIGSFRQITSSWNWPALLPNHCNVVWAKKLAPGQESSLFKGTGHVW